MGAKATKHIAATGGSRPLPAAAAAVVYSLFYFLKHSRKAPVHRPFSAPLLAAALICTGAAQTASAADSQSGSPLGEFVREVLNKPAAQQAFWGVAIADLSNGRDVFEINAGKLFVPASNAKLVSTALALEKLGPDYRFSTEVEAGGTVRDGVLEGDLILAGGGDPTLSARTLPYNERRAFAGDRLAPMAELAQQLREAGVTQIPGAIIGDDTRYVRQEHGRGWSVNDPLWGYGAPVSALAFNDNIIEMQILPGGRAGQLARVILIPDLPYYQVNNRLKTLGTRTVPTGLQLDREPGSRTILLWGDISVRSAGRRLSLAVDDPALYAAMALRDRLEALGVEVAGETLSQHAYPWEFPSLKRAAPPAQRPERRKLAAIESADLASMLTVVNKESQNLHAEMLLREVGYRQRGVGSFEAGLLELEEFLEAAGLENKEFEFHDASGLSRHNLITPAGMVKLLAYMWRSPNRADYLESLAVAGEDGTLDWRFARSRARGRILAKTGSLSHVTALSGYAKTLDGRDLAFSIFVNNFSLPQSYVRRLVDQICEAMVASQGVAAPAQHDATPQPVSAR